MRLNWSFNFTILLLALSSLFLTLGCTRAEDAKSTLSISLPAKMSSQKLNAQAFDTLGHVIINVSGPGIAQTIVYAWDGENGSSGTGMVAPPPSFDLFIPQGEGRTIQVLAVYMDLTQNKAMQFYYGDVTKDLTKPEETAVIAISSLGAGAAILSGNIMGRYLAGGTGPSFAPTGPVDVIYTPSGKPSMIIEKSYIFRGWFQFFGLVGVKFSYRLADGGLLFGKEVDLSAMDFPASSQVLRVTMPVHSRSDNRNGTVAWVNDSPNVTVMGFFGPGASTRQVCASGSGTFSKYATAVSAGATKLGISANVAALPSSSELMSGTSLSYVYLNGDSTSTFTSAVNCSPSAATDLLKFKNWIKFDSALFDNSSDMAAGFQGFFTAASANGDVLTKTAAGTGSTLAGSLLPGMDGAFDKLVLMKKVGGSSNNNGGGKVADCTQLAQQGYVPAGEAAVSPGVTAFSMPANLSTNETSENTGLALCPFKAGAPLAAGMWVRISGCTTCGNPATKLAIKELPTTATVNFCTRILVQPVDDAGNAAFVSNSFNVAFTGSTSGTGGSTIFSDSSCSVAAGTTPFVDPSGRYFFLKMPVGVSTGNTLQVNYTGSPLATGLSSSAVMTFPTASNVGGIMSMGILTDKRYTRHALECIPFYISGLDANRANINFGSAIVNFTNFSSTLLNVYGDQNCVTPLPSFDMSAFGSVVDALMPFYVRASSSGSAAVSVLEGANGCSSMTIPCQGSSGAYDIAANANAAPTQLQLNYKNSETTTLPALSCTYVSAEVKDANYWPTNSAAGHNVTVTISGGTGCNVSHISLADASCTSYTALTYDYLIPAGENRVIVGVRNIGGTSASCTVNAAITDLSISSSNNMSTSW